MEMTPSAKWFEARGDETLALDWDINPESIVWEIGGYEGRWAAQIVERYNPYIFIFEPQLWAYTRMLDTFRGKHKVILLPYGLWTYDTTLEVREHDTDGASVVRPDGRQSQMCAFKDLYPHLMTVDLCLMNIEGGEYTLLPYMIGLGLISHFRLFWCQFHPGLVGLGDEKTRRIYTEMERTHRVLWDYFPTAVAWERR